MYCPEQAKKSYRTLFIENAGEAAIKSVVFVFCLYLYERYAIGVKYFPVGLYVTLFLINCVYLTWKVKLIRLI